MSQSHITHIFFYNIKILKNIKNYFIYLFNFNKYNKLFFIIKNNIVLKFTKL